MPELIVRGATLTLNATVRNGAGALIDVDDLILAILGPDGSTIANDLVPTHISTGSYRYLYAVASDASLGAWAGRWSCTIDGQASIVEVGFTVVNAGSISTPSPGGMTCSPWATHEDITTGPCATYDMDPDLLDDACQTATDFLYLLTRRRWPGVCIDTVRPNSQFREWKTPRWWPGGSWGFCSCHRGREAGCSTIAELKLPGYPVDPAPANMTILIDGNRLDPSAYRIDDHQYVVRTDGGGWPCCQNMHLDDDEEGTFSVMYPFGAGPPRSGVRAAAMLGCQLALGWQGSEECTLPERVTSLTRQGVTMAVLDPLTLFDDGKTGLPYVDQWVSTINRGDAQRNATAIIPGRHRLVRRAGQ